MEIKNKKNEEIQEKLTLQQTAYEDKAKTKIDLMEREHVLKMARLEKQLEIAKITGVKPIDEE